VCPWRRFGGYTSSAAGENPQLNTAS
jgi:hypothetical protein